ncbi:hypothetical protein ACN1C3_17910 [Pseudomonas sp. H11T01]|uniref:hypothetical protein n=1 Tax=Pseudomonas sp. H11T01 TaxID=3402749 RepID=UPI003AC9579C
MLKHPFLNAPYTPGLGHFLGGFDIYDREDSLGEELCKYDPNCPGDRAVLICRYVTYRYRNLSYRHKFVLLSVLVNALEDEDYDFSDVLAHDPESHSSLPPGWDEMKNPRAFFEDICILATEDWVEELYKASQEDPSTW